MSEAGLNRSLAPITQEGWTRIESEAREILAIHLAARKVLDFEGPHGWEFSAIDLGRVETLEHAEASLRRRIVRPLLELRVPFTLSRAELDRVDRGARDIDLDPLREAARRFAAIEDAALFEGYADGSVPGLSTDSSNEGVALPTEGADIPKAVSEGLAQLRRAGVAGPYALVLGPTAFTALERATGDGGYPSIRHVQRLIDRPIIWASSLRGGLIVSLRGGDFKLVCGRDASIGYQGHDDESVELYLEESFNLELPGPEATVPLLPAME